MEKAKPDLERDLIDCKFIKEKVHNDNGYATRLYSALCNNRWYHNSHVHSAKKSSDYWACSWRRAGGIVSSLSTYGGDYLDYYCSGREGCVEADISRDLRLIGWRILDG
jgi:hypothetical protein|tara:strand:- start:845 stop:1171 length:327 start_codon:yes stop_codon:yes gene_type:complete